MRTEWVKGMDISSLLEVERCGGRFYDNGQPGDAMEILKKYGMNMVRLRLFHHPFAEDGSSFGAGGCDIETVLELARRAKNLGVKWMLDFHYSDCWADPGKQTIPRAWNGLSLDGLTEALYTYTKEVLERCRKENLTPDIAAIGNELTNGLLWPVGKVPQYANIARLLSAGIRAAREVDADIPVMLHLDNGGNNDMYRNWFDCYMENGGEDFDYIGLSYYPFWHGTLEMLRENMHDLAKRYGKKMIVCEVSMGHTLEDYQEYEKLPADIRVGMATKPEIAARAGYPMTPEGQSQFLRDFFEVLRSVPDGLCEGFCYWEPACLPVPGSVWATEAAREYMNETHRGDGNEWANQALFDYDGNALPALAVIQDFA